jgi:hypothetical protein
VAIGFDGESSAQHMAIDVRDDNGPLVQVKFAFETLLVTVNEAEEDQTGAPDEGCDRRCWTCD